MEDTTFRAAKGKYGYWESTDLLNSNYDVKTTLKSGSLPAGITAYAMPNDGMYDSFGFEGTPTELGTFEVTYNIAKLDGSDSIDVTFTFNVEEVSSEAKIEKIFLLKSDNKNLPQDIEGTIDDVNNTIKFTVPYGTDVTKLIARPTFYKNSTLPANFNWYGGLDFTTPVAYEVTAEDGKTKKTYMVSVEVLPTPDAITSIDIDNKITDIRVGSTHTFAATVSGFGDFDNSVSWKIEGSTSKDTTINNNGTLTIGEDESSKAIKVTATASGDTSKTIEISINVIQKQQLDKVTELLWDRRLAKWKAILNAKTYELSLYKDGQLIETIVVNTNEYDLTSFIKEAGEYSFTVVAKADGYKDSEVSDRSSVFEVKDEEPTTPTPSKLDKVENLVWNDMIATWNAVANATRYKIALYRNNVLVVEKIVDINGQEVLSLSKAANKVSYDFSQYFTTEGEYKFTVIAEADGYESSEIAGEDNNYFDNVNIYGNTRPEITANDVTIKVGESFNERQGVTAYDKEDGDLTNSIEVIENTVVTTTPGVYSVTYKVVDKKGLETTKTIVVTVLSNEKPVISGADDIQIEFGSSFDKKSGVTATDYEDKDLTASIVVTGEVNTSVAGQYELIYSVTDSDGNTTIVKRIVTVKEEVKSENPETPVVPEEPSNPDTPEEPVLPEVPSNPETPVVPEEPSNPVVPDEPVLPEEPSNPETPVFPEEPELPGDTVKPEEPVTPEVPSVDSDKEDVSITPDNKVETEKNESNKESNSEELPKTGSAVSASQLSLLSSLLIFIGSLLSRKKIKK